MKQKRPAEKARHFAFIRGLGGIRTLVQTRNC
jgi:hypothetical protein